MNGPVEPCAICGTPLAAVGIVSSGRHVVMRSCTRCNRRWWTADGRPVDPTQLFRSPAAR
jgi:hypothetical protein